MADFAAKITLSAASPVPEYDVSPWALGVLEASSGEATTSDSNGLLVDCSPVGEYADIAQGGNYVAVDSWTIAVHAVTPGRVKWWDAFRAAGASMYGARVELWDVTADLCRAVGVVTDAVLSGMEVRIECESILTARHKEIPTRTLTKDEFPDMPADAVGHPVPTLYGAVERLACTPILSERQYYEAAAKARTNILDATEWTPRNTSTWIVVGGHSGIMIEYQFPGITFVPAVSDYPEWCADVAGGDVYVEVTSGTGAGQFRQVLSYGVIQSWTNPQGATIYFLPLTIAAAWDDPPANLASTMRVYSQDVDGILVVGDQATVLRVHGEGDQSDFPVRFVQGTIPSGVTADLSSSLASGAPIESIELIYPAIANDDEVNDGSLWTSVTYVGCYAGETLPGAIVTDAQITPYFKRNLTAFRAFAKVASTSSHADSGDTGFILRAQANRLSGVSDLAQLDVPDPCDSYPPWMQPGGTASDYSLSALKVTSEETADYASIDIDVTVTNASHTGIQESPVTSCTFTNGSTSVTMVGSIDKDYNTVDLTDCVIRPKGCPRGQWARVAAYTEEPGFPMYAIDIVLVDPWPFATFSGTEIEVLPADYVFDVEITELSVGLVFGELTASSGYIVDVSSGREDSTPAPISLARAAAVDIMTRDLGLSASTDIDSASFAGLPADMIRAALVERERSDVILARMAREWNWIIGHDGAGRERATTWLNRLWTSEYDYAVANGDIIADSMAESATAIDDVICQPSLSWDWTHADGFRSSAIVTDITVDPDDLTEGNYLQTISGFGGFEDSLSAYSMLFAAYASSQERGEESLEWRYGGDPIDLYVNSGRMWWAASRKRILDLKVPETHAAMASVVGDRIRVTHRRATAGNPAYGTLAGRWWHPVDGVLQLLVILDPPEPPS